MRRSLPNHHRRGDGPGAPELPRAGSLHLGQFDGFAPDAGSSFEVDLTQMDQSSYEFLNNGDAVTVVGYVSRDGNKLIAVSITPDR
jgi:hypothetical protein